MPTLTADSMVARAILAANRPVRSPSAITHPERMDRQDKLEVWYDTQHAFLITPGCLAIRAINDQGRFCWLVRQHGEEDAISYVQSPFDVVFAQDGDSGLRVPYPSVADLAASLRRGNIRITLAANDFRGNGRPLQILGSHGMSGRLAAWLMPLIPSIGRAIWAGHRRVMARSEPWRSANQGPMAHV